MQTDHLGSLTEIINALDGSIEHRQSFDAWGQSRNSSDWSENAVNQLFADRGFTGHEHLPSVFGLIDMNGRMYDPKLGRFLSPDPYVQSPSNSQSFNRYSYCLNNPLIYTDPSGEKWKWPSWEAIHCIPVWGQFVYAMDMINENTTELRQDMVDAGVPGFNAGYNSSKGFGYQVGDNSWVYPEEIAATNNGIAATGEKFDIYVETQGTRYNDSSGGDTRTNLLESNTPIGDIFQSYQGAIRNGNCDNMYDIIIPNGFGKGYYNRYSKYSTINDNEYKIAIQGFSSLLPESYYNIYDVGFGYLDRFSDYKVSTKYFEGYSHGFYVVGYDQQNFIYIGAKTPKGYQYLKTLYHSYDE